MIEVVSVVISLVAIAVSLWTVRLSRRTRANFRLLAESQQQTTRPVMTTVYVHGEGEVDVREEIRRQMDAAQTALRSRSTL